MLTLEKRDRIRSNVRQFTGTLPDGSNSDLLVNAFDEIMEEVVMVESEKASTSEIKLLIVEMREGFKRVDNRFESMQHQMDQRFNSLQWFMGISLTVLALLITLFGYLKPPITADMLEKAIISGIEKAKIK
ncbi:MAG: hypothetical protein OEV66_00645 [Spirochaetia bacterium]|nr:hypothetical protein [Spirochaetia bacterium]